METKPSGTLGGFFFVGRAVTGPLKLRLIVCSRERDAEPVFFPPYDAAMPAHLIGLHDQREFVGNGQRKWNIEGSASL